MSTKRSCLRRRIDARPNPDKRTLKSSLEVVRLELEQTAKARLELCHNMRTELERKLAELIVGQATVRKQHQTVAEKNMKNKVAQASVVAKLREKYEARCMEVQQLMTSRSGLPPKEIEKVRLKLETAQAAAKKTDGEYQEAVAKLKDLHSKWETEWRVACEVGKMELGTSCRRLIAGVPMVLPAISTPGTGPNGIYETESVELCKHGQHCLRGRRRGMRTNPRLA